MLTKRRLSWIWVAVLALVVSGCSSASLGTPGAPDHQYRVALSMSYSGNDWQGEAANLMKLTAAKDPKITEFKQYISGTQAQNQISQLQQMILKKFDAIIIYPISPTALNQTIKQGCDAGILMMTYDAQVTEPCAHNITFDQTAAGTQTAEALSDLMGNKGNVVLITGVAGTSVDEARTAAAKAVFEKRGITVLDQCAGDWAQGPAGQCMNRFLAAFNNIDGVWAQVGGPAVLDALDAAGRPYVPILSESENRFRQALIDPAYVAKGLKGCHLRITTVAGCGRIANGHRFDRNRQEARPGDLRRLSIPHPGPDLFLRRRNAPGHEKRLQHLQQPERLGGVHGRLVRPEMDRQHHPQ